MAPSLLFVDSEHPDALIVLHQGFYYSVPLVKQGWRWRLRLRGVLSDKGKKRQITPGRADTYLDYLGVPEQFR